MADNNERLIPRRAIELIMEYGDCKLKAYPFRTDGKAITYKIGYGCTQMPDGTDVDQWSTLRNEAEAQEALIKELNNRYLPMLSTIPYWMDMNDNQRAALFSFCWDTEPYFWQHESRYPGFAYHFKERSYEAIATLIGRRNEINGRKSLPLIHKRNAQVTLWNKPGPNSQRCAITTVNINQSTVVLKDIPFKIVGVCSPALKGRRVSAKINNKQVKGMTHVDPDGYFELEHCLTRSGRYQFKVFASVNPVEFTVYCVNPDLLSGDISDLKAERLVVATFDEDIPSIGDCA